MLRTRQFNQKPLSYARFFMDGLSKNVLKLLPILIIVANIGVFSRSNEFLFFSNEKPTYVEGFITRDTVWTLTDSPFIVSGNVIVYANATLTIEPKVEVRFGGNFSLTVNGRLIANGTQENWITFTSNKASPSAGDWGNITIGGMGLSLLRYCFVKYARCGIIVESGNVEIKNSMISNNLKDGIKITSSIAKIQNNEIAYNNQSGIFITGTNQIVIENNTINLNGDGIFLTENSVSGVNINQNIISSNTRSGINLNANAYANVTVLYNTLSANGMGFYVSGPATTSITNNSISYNTIGIYYEQATDHQAHWNDIYGNGLGMDVAPYATVNATYNYWGDFNGPYHASLNPKGRGDSVGGDGTNLKFIFFLTAPISYINQRPTAYLSTDKKWVPPNQSVTFIATASTDDRRVNMYLFDFGDGKNSGWTTLSIISHEYSSEGTYDATLKVMDDFGVINNNTATVRITCQNVAPLSVSISLSSSIIGSSGEVSITAYVTDGTMPKQDVNVTLLSTVGGNLAPSSGLTNSTGHFTATFNAPNVIQITYIRITATASYPPFYADGSDYEYLMIQPPLAVHVSANPDIIKSEATSNVAVHVTYNDAPVPEAIVTMMSESGGNFDKEFALTDENGDCTFVFSAPQRTTTVDIVLTATATKNGYITGQGQTTITIEPKTLLVQVIADPVSIESEKTSNITVYVTYDAIPIPSASVVLSSDKGGSFYPSSLTTDINGECKLTFIAPLVTTPTNITITATASKTGYANGTNQTTLTVDLGALNVGITSEPVRVESGKQSTITVHVTYNAKPVANAIVTVTSDVSGAFSTNTGMTDENGDCTFIFTAPETTTEFAISVYANATKTGYTTGQGQTVIIATPPSAAGFPWIYIFLIVIVVVIIVIILVLIKLKVIVISWKED